jgi:PhnB protein
MHAPGSKKVMHSCLQIGSSKVFVHDEMPNMPGRNNATLPSMFTCRTSTPRTSAQLAMKELYAPTDMFWGDRTSVLACPFGNHWTLATHISNPSEAEMVEAMKQWASKSAAH